MAIHSVMQFGEKVVYVNCFSTQEVCPIEISRIKALMIPKKIDIGSIGSIYLRNPDGYMAFLPTTPAEEIKDELLRRGLRFHEFSTESETKLYEDFYILENKDNPYRAGPDGAKGGT